MAVSTVYLGPPGALARLPDPLQGPVESARVRKGGTHELLSGGTVRDTLGYRRQVKLTWKGLTADELSVLEALYELGGPLRFLDPSRRNLLTVNQSTGTDALDDTTGFAAPPQGTVTSDTTQFRSGSRSLKWDTVTSLSVTDRGVWLPTNGTTPDATWAAVLPSTVYTFSAYARANAAITMYAALDWKDAAGALLSTDFGTGTAVGTADWSTRLTVANKTSPATAAYAVPAVLDSTAPSAIRQVWVDDPQLEQATAASAWALGTGVPLVVVDSFTPSSPINAPVAVFNADMVLVEV